MRKRLPDIIGQLARLRSAARLLLLCLSSIFIGSALSGQNYRISVGDDFGAVIDDTGALFIWGAFLSSSDGTLEQVPGAWSEVSVSRTAASEAHILAISSTGALFAWGSNDRGQLGLGDQNDRDNPTQVGSDSDWVEVAAGDDHSLARNATGEVFAWGDNSFGQLNLEPINNNPEQDFLNEIPDASISATDRYISISAGNAHNHAIRDDFTLWTWGFGDPDSNGGPELGILVNGTFARAPISLTQVGSLNGWQQLFGGYRATFALRDFGGESGQLWVWGSGGNLGIVDAQDRAITVSATPTRVGTDSDWAFVSHSTFDGGGNEHALGLKTDGSLFGWGVNNPSGALGLRLDDDEGVEIVEHRRKLIPFALQEGSSFLAVGAGDGFSFIVRSDNEILSAGFNDVGQLANGSIDSTPEDGQDSFGETQLGRPDIVAEEVIITSEIAGISSGDQITFTVRLSNNGTGSVDFGSAISFFDAVLVPISELPPITNQALINLQYMPVPASTILVPSGELVLTLQGEVPAGISIGDYQLEVTADAEDAVDEADESNNVALSDVESPVVFTVDLAPSGNIEVDMPDPSYDVGDTFTVNFGIQNLGTGDLDAVEQDAFNIRFVLTPDFEDLSEESIIELSPTGGSPVLLIDEDLPADGTSSYTDSIEFTIPSGVEAIGYYVAILIDVNGVFSEIDELNNFQFTLSKQIQIGDIALDIALDDPGRVFQIGGNGDWFGFAFAGAEGGDDAAFSPQLEAGEEASFRTTVVDASIISFKWRASTSGASDFLQLNAGAQVLTLSGETEWIDVSVAVGAGTEVVWTYFAGSGGPDERVFVDDLSVVDLVGPDILVPAALLLDDTFTPINNISLVAGLDSFRLAYELKNQGDDLVTPNFDVAVYLSRDSSLDIAEDTQVGTTYTYPVPMPSGFSDTIINTYTPPPDLFGDYYVIVQVTGVTGESGAAILANNTFVSDTASVNIQPLPDLSLELNSINGNIFYPGNAIFVNYNLLNRGYGDAFGTIQLRLVLSDDDVYSPGDDFTIGEGISFGGIAAGTPFVPNTSLKNFSLFSFPAGLPIGDFKFIGLVVDSANAFTESDETNNAVFFPNPDYAFGLFSLEEAVDLVDSAIPYLVISDETAPFSTGFPFFGQTEVSNDGFDAARSAVIGDGEKSFFDVEILVPAGDDAIANFFWKVSSEDDNNGKSDDLILFLKEGTGSFEIQKTIAGEVDWTEEFLLLPGDDVNPTTYTLRFSYEKDASESSGDDFAYVDQITVLSLTQPDFIPLNIALTDSGGSVIESGIFRIEQDTLSLNYTFANIGQDYDSVASGQDLKLSFFLSEDAVLDVGDLPLGVIDTAPLGLVDLASGDSISGSITFDLESPSLTSGLFYLIAQADPDGDIAELDEVNNIDVSTIQIIELVAEADLTIEFDDPDELAGGLILQSEPIGEVTLTVQNLGAGSVSDEHVIALLLQDNLGVEDDVLLRQFTSTEILSGASGSTPSYEFVRTIDVAGTAAPLGRLLGLVGSVDFLNEIAESDETNNLTVIPQTSPFVFAEVPLWQALNPDLLNPAVVPDGFSGTESILLVNDATAPFEGDLPFVGLIENSPLSEDIARSIAMGSGQSGAFTIDVSLDEEAALVFVRKADDLNTNDFTSTLYGEFDVQLDATAVPGIPPLVNEADWSEELLLPIPAGDHTITWSFDRDDTVPVEGLNVFAFVDGIRFLPDLELQLVSIENPVGPDPSDLNLAPSDALEITVDLENTNLGAVPESSVYGIEARLSADTLWDNDDFVMDVTLTPTSLPALAAGATESVLLQTTIPQAVPLGAYYLLLRVDPGPEENSQLVNLEGNVREVDEDNNDAGSASALISITALSIEDALDIDPIGFDESYFRAVFPTISLDKSVQTGDASWADSPDIEIKEFSDKWFASAGVTGATDGDAILTSELEADSSASLLFRLEQPRLVSFRARPNTLGSANYLFFGANGNELRPEGNLLSRISGNSAIWETRYYVVPAEAPLGFTYVQGTTPDPDPLNAEFVYIDDLVIGAPLDKPDYVIDALQYEAGNYVLERDRLFVVLTGSNRGLGVPLNPDIKVRIWLSTDATFDGSDTLLGDLEQFQELDGGTRFGYQASLIIPETVPEGNYFLIARVDADTSVNAFGAVDEFAVDASTGALISEPAAFSENDNNFLISPANDIFIDRRADLRIVPSEDSVFNEIQVYGPAAQSDEEIVDFFVIEPSDYIIPSGEFAEGPSELLIKFDLLNEGLSGVSAADGDDFVINVYAATSREEAPSEDRLITSIPVENGIAAGSRQTFEVTTAIPENIDAGSFYFVNVVVDGTEVIDESDESDNSTFSPHNDVFVSDVSLEVALNDEDFFDEDSNTFTHIWDKSFVVPTQNDSTIQAPFFGTTNPIDIGQDISDSGVRAAAQSGPVLGGGQSWLQKTVDVTSGDVQVSFLWRVSSQFEVLDGVVLEDVLLFAIRYEGEDDFTEIASISGEADWRELIFTITRQGTHTLRWSYIENGDNVRAGRDAGWIDDYSESAYDFVPTFVPLSGLAPFEAGDAFPLPVFVWNIGELRIPDNGIDTTLRLTPTDQGDTNNLDWTIPNSSDVILQDANEGYDTMGIADILELQASMIAADLLVLNETPYAILIERMDSAILGLLTAEEEEAEPELEQSVIDGLKAVLNAGTWLDYSQLDLENILADSLSDAPLVEGTPAEKAARKRFIPVRTYSEALTIPDLLSVGGDYYIGVWANPAGFISESNFSNNLLFSESALIDLIVDLTIPEALDRSGTVDMTDPAYLPSLLSDPVEWNLDGDGRWFPTDDSFAGVFDADSLRSPQDEMPQDGEASVFAMIEGPRLIRFRWRADFGTSEDVASFYVNDALVSREADGPGSGSMSINRDDDGAGWIEEQYFLPAGLNEIRWTFARVNNNLPQGDVYLDNVRFEDVSGEADLAISSIVYTGGTYALERDPFPLTVNVVNRGSLPVGFNYNDLDLEIRLGSSTDFESANQLVGNLSVVDVLDEGQRLIFQGEVDLPVNLEPGTYYLLARVKSLDPDFEEFTYDTSQELLSNNDYASFLQDVTIVQLPQLTVRTNFVENEKLFYPKETIRFDWEVENIGLGDIPFGTELTQTIQLWSVDVTEAAPSLATGTFVLNVGEVTETTALPGRLTATDPSQSTIEYKEIFRLPSQADLLAALDASTPGLEDMDVEVLSALGEFSNLRFFFVLTRDNSIEQSSNLNVTAVTNELFRIAPFAYDPAIEEPGLIFDNTFIDYDTLQPLLPLWLNSVGVTSPTGTWYETFGGGDFENIYYYAFNLPFLTDLTDLSPRVERRSVDGGSRDETGYYLTRQ
ncbi:MAG: CARDB domain-containing protein [Verrucomicrobiota bacterium]